MAASVSAAQQTGLTQLYGIAYVDFTSHEDAQKAMDALQGSTLGMH
jgi:RNA recognition motif-containing protein